MLVLINITAFLSPGVVVRVRDSKVRCQYPVQLVCGSLSSGTSLRIPIPSNTCTSDPGMFAT